MPELPDVTVYIDALGRRIVGQSLRRIRIVSPFVLRTFDPPIERAEGRVVVAIERLGKRIVLVLEGDLFLVIHLMIAGRFRWADAGPGGAPRPPGGKITLASFEFDSGVLALTEASTKKRASIHLADGRDALAAFSRGGIDVLAADLDAFGRTLARERRTLKRALTDPRLFDGIGNAYSDEILHAARLSPFKQTTSLDRGEVDRLFGACRWVLDDWIARLRRQFKDGRIFPGAGQITAFRPDFAVHGRFGEPCPVCGTKVQRIVYAEREFNYCPVCQTDGRILADRSLSRLLRDNWPGTVEELERLED